MAKSEIKEQLTHINPSVPDAFYRRLLREDNLSYLRENMNSIIGFEIDLNKSCALSGYALIAIKKHSILAYRSDLHEKKKLIIFPSLEKLFDSSFELLNLTVTKSLYNSYSFKGKPLEHGQLKDVVKDLTPAIEDVDLPQNVSEKMMSTMLQTKESLILEDRKNFGSSKVDVIDSELVQRALNAKKSSTDSSETNKQSIDATSTSNPSDTSINNDDMPQDDMPQDDIPQYDNPTVYDMSGDIDIPIDEEIGMPMDGYIDDMPMDEEIDTPMGYIPFESDPDEESMEYQHLQSTSNIQHAGPVEVERSTDPRIQELENSHFTSVQEISNKAIMLGVPAHVSSQIVTSVLQKSSDTEERITILRLLYIRIFKEGKFKV